MSYCIWIWRVDIIREVDSMRWWWMVGDERVSWSIDDFVDHLAIERIIFEMVKEYLGWNLCAWLPLIMKIDFMGGLWVFCDERVVRFLDDVVDHVMVKTSKEVTWSIQSELSHDSKSWYGYIRWIPIFRVDHVRDWERCLRLWS